MRYFVVVAVPLGRGDDRLDRRARLAAMTQTGFLINVVRGEVVAEEPLFFALRVFAGSAARRSMSGTGTRTARNPCTRRPFRFTSWTTC